jgi:hypothetical protein
MRARISAVVLLAVVGTAAADQDPGVAAAKAQARRASELAAARDYAGAAVAFREAHRLDPRPEYICNVGVAYQRAKQLPHAQIYLGECLRRGQSLDAKFIDVIRTGLAEVESKLRAGSFAPVDITLRPEGGAITISTFDADESFIGAQVVWLPFGAHTIEASSEGYTSERRTLTVAAQTQQHLRFELRRVEQPAAPTKPGVETEPPDVAPDVHERARPSKVPPVVATIGTLALGGAALGTFLQARTTMDTAGSTFERTEYERLVDRARTWQHASWAFAGAAGLGAIASVVLWLRASDSTTVEVAPTGGGGRVTLSGTW